LAVPSYILKFCCFPPFCGCHIKAFEKLEIKALKVSCFVFLEAKPSTKGLIDIILSEY
jgi:hypothetical protein